VDDSGGSAVSTVELRFTAVPAHVRTARLVVVSLGRRLGVEEELLDEVRLAVGEAAGRAVRRHQECCPDAPVLVRMTSSADRFVVEVADSAAAPSGPAPGVDPLDDLAAHASQGSADVDALPPGLDLAVIGGLVNDRSVHERPDGSTVVMRWSLPANRPPVVGPAGASG
jgi:anti-sigma regulatory factor (Ser/Thr protein kinase)